MGNRKTDFERQRLRQVHACDTWLEHGTRAAYLHEHLSEPSPHGELITIGRLYFPELDENLQRLLVKYRQAAQGNRELL
jgi:hypothetical protein